MDTIGRLIRRVPAGTASTSNAFEAQRALGSLTAQVALTSDINLLALRSPYRPLASIPGFADVSRPSPTGTTAAPTPDDFDWMSPLVVPFVGGALPANACLGTHAIHRDPAAPSVWPKAVLRARVNPPASPYDKLGAILLAVPGRGSTLRRAAVYTSTALAGGGGWQNLELSLPLTDAAVAPVSDVPAYGNGGSSGPSSVAEVVSFMGATFWCAFFSSGSTKGEVAAITLALEPV